MASLIDSLINIMNDENRQYTELLDLSNNKTTAIVKGDVGQLQEIFGKEQKLIDILNRLETVSYTHLTLPTTPYV